MTLGITLCPYLSLITFLSDDLREEKKAYLVFLEYQGQACQRASLTTYLLFSQGSYFAPLVTLLRHLSAFFFTLNILLRLRCGSSTATA